MENRFKHFVSPQEIVPNRPEMETIKLTKQIEDEFFAEGEDAPVAKIAARLLRAGASEKDVELYTQAVKAYFQESSLTLLSGEFEKDQVTSFRPSEYYFGPKITFHETVKLLPVISSLPDVRPKLQKREQQKIGVYEVDGQGVLDALGGADLNQGAKTISPEERFLVQLNRLAYALHEPFHTIQASGDGDAVNRLLAEIDATDLVDPNLVGKILRESGRNLVHFHIRSPFGVEKSVIGLPKDLLPAVKVDERNLTEPEKSKIASEEYNQEDTRSSWFDNQFEASMDILSQDVLKDYLENKPALLFWCHNMLSSVVEATRVCRQNLVDKVSIDGKMLTKLKDLWGFAAPLYFSVFENSNEFEEYIQKHKDQPALLGRFLSGNVAKNPSFNWLEVEDLFSDCRILQTGKSSMRWNFPISGRMHLVPISELSASGGMARAGERDAPITKEGAELVGRLSAAAAKKDWDYSRFQDLLTSIQQAILLPEEPVFEMEHIPVEIDRVRQEILLTLGVDLSRDEMKEMFGTSFYLNIHLSSTYSKRLNLRKELFHALEDSSPEHVDPLVSGLFYTMPFSAPKLAEFAGFYEERRPEGGVGLVHQRFFPWEEVSQNRSFGPLALDVTKLNDQDREELRVFVETFPRRYRKQLFFTQHAYTEPLIQILKQISAWKRKQAKQG